ncbi:GNAT family N-acetyltransferase [Cellulosimicrobium sp. CUA-896]|uniref:GNAT family N-acetyltransferase n=1 Tax=Cellulosimicrobium sp. CUA-896 TaxID=1517881 RepID=UPI000963C09A|nr:GNAT family N-acetyltransferase [Cellulosimicrobium sp. CUA-896]OLT53626.1 GNAT family N-acetyltransferase [Cellulosimicrobium sp. CUA-896]
MDDQLHVRAATGDDWPGIWRALEPVLRAGETYTYPRDITEDAARTAWAGSPGARVLVAVDATGRTVLGTAKYLPNHPGAGAHVANASFVVDRDASGRGVGRALAHAVLDGARADGYRAMQFNAVVETNERAVRLWESLGFTVLATVPEAFDHPALGLVGLHIMHRTL